MRTWPHSPSSNARTLTPPLPSSATRYELSKQASEPAGCRGTAANPGALLFIVTRKCHELFFENEAWFLDGPNGERAVLHATANGTVKADVQLPSGWTLKKETLASPLVLHPFGGGDECFYNIIRDHELQSYHQFKYARPQYP